MKRTSVVGIITALFFSNTSWSGTLDYILNHKWTWINALSMGPIWENEGGAQTFNLTPEIEKTYTADKKSQTLFNGELFIGLQKMGSPMLQEQIGLAVAATNGALLSGHIWDDADPTFDNFTYRYKIQHTHIAAKAKLAAELGYWLMPWISASVGIGFNNSYSFTNTPLIYEAIPNPNFASHTKTAFTYTVGAGIQKILTIHWQVGAGYEFADWGKNTLGRAQAQTLNSGLGMNHFYTNGLLFNISYVT